MKTSQAVVDQLLDQRERFLADIESGNSTLCKHCALADLDDAIFFYKAQERNPGWYLSHEIAGHA